MANQPQLNIKAGMAELNKQINDARARLGKSHREGDHVGVGTTLVVIEILQIQRSVLTKFFSK